MNNSMTELRSRLETAGCFEPALVRQSAHMLAVLALYAGAYTVLLLGPGIVTRLLMLILLAFCSVQAGFIGHEACHGALNRHRWLAELIGQVYMTFLTALCHAHFQKIHRRHHSRCNERGADVDLESNVFSLYREAVDEKRSWIARFITRHQALLIWPLVSLQGFTLKMDSVGTLRADPRSTRADQMMLFLHCFLWIGPPVYFLGPGAALINYVLMTWMLGPYLGTIFIVNHVGTRVVDPDERIPRLERILTTTRNLGDTRTSDVFFGGLNSHIEHHLFPTIASARLPRARAIVRTYCRERRLPYRETTWLGAAKEVCRYLGEIARGEIPARAGDTDRRAA